jgi:hypothetical protein
MHFKEYGRVLEAADRCLELTKEEPDEDKIDSNIRMVNQEYNDSIHAYNYFAENGAK